MKKLNKLTIDEALKLLAKKDVSSVELTQACLSQIKNTDDQIKAFVNLSSHALTEAKKADQLRSSGKKLPLLGIPIALKDNYLTTNLPTTASSNVLKDYTAPYDATVVTKLKQAGAVILGKTNMDAWAHGSSTETSDFGTTHNPHDLNKSPGGSSGGSAAAVAADQTIAALGTETAGSIRVPASWCGIVGLKPTYGRVSRYGIIAMASSLDSPGPMTKTVKDSAILLSVIAGKDDHDATTPQKPVSPYHQELNNQVKGLRIGLPKEYFLKEAQPGVNELVKQAANQLQSLGASLHEVSMIDPKYAVATYTVAQRSEVFSNLARYDGIRYGQDRTYFGQEAKRRIMLGAHVLKIDKQGQFYQLSRKARMLMEQDFNRVFNNIDLILAPTTPSTAVNIGDSQENSMFGELTDLLQEPSSLTGLTAISIPCGLINNMPVGMQFIANDFEEQTVLNAAYAYEQNYNWRDNVHQ